MFQYAFEYNKLQMLLRAFKCSKTFKEQTHQLLIFKVCYLAALTVNPAAEHFHRCSVETFKIRVRGEAGRAGMGMGFFAQG